jgi:hypothetical protein
VGLGEIKECWFRIEVERGECTNQNVELGARNLSMNLNSGERRKCKCLVEEKVRYVTS